jgi:hypothetical protein
VDASPAPGPPSGWRLERLLRWVWLLIGVVVLALLLFGAGFLALEWLGGSGAPPSPLPAADSAPVHVGEGLRYEPPLAVAGTATRLVLIHRASGYGYPSASPGRDPRAAEGALVNVAFVQGERVRLLLDRPAFIRRIRYPGADSSAAGASAGRWIVYEMALEDADHNGSVDDRDPRSLYATDLEGEGLRALLPEGVEPRGWAAQPDGSLLLTGIELGGAAGPVRQRAFRLSPAGTVTPWTALDSAVAAATRVAGEGRR